MWGKGNSPPVRGHESHLSDPHLSSLVPDVPSHCVLSDWLIGEAEGMRQQLCSSPLLHALPTRSFSILGGVGERLLLPSQKPGSWCPSLALLLEYWESCDCTHSCSPKASR